MDGFKNFIESHDINASIVGDYISSPNITANELAKKYSKSKAEIYRILQKHMIRPNRLRKNHEQVKNLIDLGYNDSDVASYTGYTTRNIRYLKKKMKGD